MTRTNRLAAFALALALAPLCLSPAVAGPAAKEPAACSKDVGQSRAPADDVDCTATSSIGRAEAPTAAARSYPAGPVNMGGGIWF